ncbi:hypothetical protein SRABI106_00946 [Rahnella aquatilis]|nr:hypothetical protein SRABI106_00946 [Rahnella aquatilis]
MSELVEHNGSQQHHDTNNDVPATPVAILLQEIAQIQDSHRQQ